MTEAPAFSVVADVAIVKGETPASDRTWLSFPDGTARRAVVHVIHDLPHLVVESAFDLDDGLWGTLAAGGYAPASRAATRRNSRIRLVTDAEPDEIAVRTWPAHVIAKAAANAVLNRWGDGPDTPDGVRAGCANPVRARPSWPPGWTTRRSGSPGPACSACTGSGRRCRSAAPSG